MTDLSARKRLALFLAITAYVNPVGADYVFHEGDYGKIAGSLRIQTTTLIQANNWFGNPHPEMDDLVWEVAAEPGMQGELNLSNGSQLYGAYHFLYTASIGHDPSGLSLGGNAYPRTGLTELAYIGWRSKDWLADWGENALELSIGRQDYSIGTGFLIIDGAGDGGRRGAWWIGARTAFDNALVGRFNSGPYKVEGFHLETRPRRKEQKSVYDGANFEYHLNEDNHIGFSYIHLSQDFFNKGAHVYNGRLSFKPLPSVLPGLSLSAEYAHQSDHADFQAEGGFAQIRYQFVDWPWKPALSYRYTSLAENFNFIAYGFTDWGTWYQGEIIGEHILAHENTDIHLFRLQFEPGDLVINLMYYYLNLTQVSFYPPLVPGYVESHLTSNRYVDEFNVMVDWNANDRLSISATAAVAVPRLAARQDFGGANKTWFQGMVYASFEF